MRRAKRGWAQKPKTNILFDFEWGHESAGVGGHEKFLSTPASILGYEISQCSTPQVGRKNLTRNAARVLGVARTTGKRSRAKRTGLKTPKNGFKLN